MRDGFIKVAASTPEIRVADVDYNKELIAQGMDQAWKDGIQLLVYGALSYRLYLRGSFLAGGTSGEGAPGAYRACDAQPRKENASLCGASLGKGRKAL